jgi:hypothetical protein
LAIVVRFVLLGDRESSLAGSALLKVMISWGGAMAVIAPKENFLLACASYSVRAMASGVVGGNGSDCPGDEANSESSMKPIPNHRVRCGTHGDGFPLGDRQGGVTLGGVIGPECNQRAIFAGVGNDGNRCVMDEKFKQYAANLKQRGCR